MKLRKYQGETLDYIEASYAFGSQRIIVDSPTGSGKSLMIAEACKRMASEKIVILVNVSKLIGQISEHLDVLGVDHSILKAGMEDKYDESKRVQLFMEQTYESRKDKIHFHPEVFIRDEHHIGFTGSRLSGLLSRFSPRLVIGFSATPYDNYGVALQGYETASFTSVKKLTDQHYLMPGDTWVPSIFQKLDFSKIGKSGDYTESELDSVLNTPEYNKAVVHEYAGWYGRQAIVFVSGIDHANDLAAEFTNDGVLCEAYHSKNTAKVNDEIMSDFRSGKISVLVSVSSLTTGFDYPDCSMVINCRPTKIRSLYIQMVGRVLRLSNDPLECAVILDCCKATEEHGLYDEEYNIPKTRADASEERKRRSEHIINYMADKQAGTLLITREKLKREKELAKKDASIEAKMYRFKFADDIESLLVAASYLYEHFYGEKHNASKVEWILEEVKPAMSWMPLNAIRSRLRKMLETKKKFGGIRGYPKWFKENVLGGQYE